MSSNATCIVPKGTHLTEALCNNSIGSPNTNLTCGAPGIFFVCNQSTLLRCFPTNWSLPCVPVFLTPPLTVLSPEAMTTLVSPGHRRRRAFSVGALLLGGGLFAAAGLGTGGIGRATHFYYKLSTGISQDLDKVANSLMALQTQITSLAGVALQNHRALDLLTAEKGGTGQFLGEECCFFC